jgi:hypothetical protein
VLISHFTTIDTQIRDIDALADTCRELQLTLEPNATARGYAGATHPGEHVIRLQGPYDIAVNRQDNGSLGFTADLWQGHVEAEAGKDYSRIKQLYGVHKTTREARRKGLNVRRRDLRNGHIRLQLVSA